MSYQLEIGEPIARGVKRILTEQVDKALHSLQDSNNVLDERIHDARKRFKKIRAVMRLIRDEVGEDVYQRENATYRDAGRELSELRDSVVMIETLDKIKDKFGDELDDTSFDDLREQLVSRNRNIRYETVTANTLERVAAQIMVARTRIEDLPIKQDDFSAFRDGLERVYQRGYEGFDEAYDDPSPENFHEWRKRVKYLWYHMRILRLVWDDVQGELADAIHDLADILGDAHDLAVFEDAITSEIVPDETTAQALRALASRWREDLEAQAKPSGQRIYAEKPKRFVKRMGIYWDAAQQQAALTQ